MHTLQTLLRGRTRRRLLVLGAGKLAYDLADELRRRPELGYDLVGVLDLDADAVPTALGSARQTTEFAEIAREIGADAVVWTDGDVGLDANALAGDRSTDVHILDGVSFYEEVTGRIRLETPASTKIFQEDFAISESLLRSKRWLDVAIAAVGLVALAPLFALIALAIRLDTRGPVFYSQERVGFRGLAFKMWKFRSMRVDAESDEIPRWAQEDDPRVTRVGAVLRRFSLDELPQLWNILRGEMSVVGPRPEREHFVRNLCELSPFYLFRTAVRPGLTGWAQIKAPYASSYENSLYKLSFDLFYIKTASIPLDLRVIAGTFRVVLFGRPAGPDEADERG